MGHTSLAVSNLNTGYKLQWFWLGISFYNICQIQVTVICLLGIFFTGCKLQRFGWEVLSTTDAMYRSMRFGYE